MNIVYNIPHAGTTIPKWALEDFTIPLSEIKNFNLYMVDAKIDELFSCGSMGDKIISKIARVVVDMERYRDDSKEVMASLGMGLFYEKDYTGKVIRTRGSTYNRCLSIYDRYHARLERKIESKLTLWDDPVLILDCHSFHDGQTFTPYPTNSFPDVCIGVNSGASDETNKIVDCILDIVKKAGYSTAVNMPFEGSLVPEKFADNPRVHTVMLELNRRIYFGRDNDFHKTQDLCWNICRKLSRL